MAAFLGLGLYFSPQNQSARAAAMRVGAGLGVGDILTAIFGPKMTV